VDIFASSDVSTTINTGVLLVKNTNWAMTFLELWRSLCCVELAAPIDVAANDQLGFDVVYNTLHDRYRKKISILEAHEINTILPAMKTFHNPIQNPILHLAAETQQYRNTVFKAIMTLSGSALGSGAGSGSGVESDAEISTKRGSDVLDVTNTFLLDIAVDV